jgi:PAS domain S-box-containing protein
MSEEKTRDDLLIEIYNLKEKIKELEKSVEDAEKADRIIKERENYQKTIFYAIQTGIVVLDAETQQIIDVNDVAADIIGASKDEIIGHSCHRYICPAEVGKCPIIDLNQSVDHSERILLDVEGREIPIIKNVVKVNLNGRECLLESFIDITDRLEAEKALIHSEEKYRSIVEKFLKISNQIILDIGKD